MRNVEWASSLCLLAAPPLRVIAGADPQSPNKGLMLPIAISQQPIFESLSFKSLNL